MSRSVEDTKTAGALPHWNESTKESIAGWCVLGRTTECRICKKKKTYKGRGLPVVDLFRESAEEKKMWEVQCRFGAHFISPTHPVSPCTFHSLPQCEFSSLLHCHKGTSVHLLPVPLLSGRPTKWPFQASSRSPWGRVNIFPFKCLLLSSCI